MDTIIRGLLDTISLNDGLSVRKDCPYCGGHNTFTLKKERNELLWNCYKLDCRVKGRENVSMSKAEIIASTQYNETNDELFLTPLPHWVQPNMAMHKWMRLWGVLSAFEQGRLHGMYDPKEDRYVFLAYANGRLVAAQGRSAAKHHTVKWKHYYGTVRSPFIIPRQGTYMRPEYGDGLKVGIIVEDITSAAVVSEYADGIALMGTNLLDDYMPMLQMYDKLIIHLDKDANGKAMEMAVGLNWYTIAKVILSDQDPKNMTKLELEDLYGGVL